MISVYKISDYILLMKSKRRHFYYINSKLKRLSYYNDIKNRILKPLKGLNKVIRMLRGWNPNWFISVDAYGHYNAHGLFGDFNCNLLGGMQ